MERGRKMTENSYKTRCGCIHYFVNLIDKQKITLVFLPGLTADHRLFEKQTEYLEKKQDQRYQFPKDKILILYCDRGGASMQAARSLARAGCRTRSVIGGFAAYRGRNLVSG